MNAMGCSLLLMAAAALLVGFIPILTWINVFIALPLAFVSAITAGLAARKPASQPADKAMFWFSVALGATILLRVAVL